MAESKIPLRVVRKLVSTGLYREGAQADIVPLKFKVEFVFFALTKIEEAKLKPNVNGYYQPEMTKNA